MPWIKMRGVDGLVYEPEPQPAGQRKHNCRDCFYCQMCSDARCAVCLNRNAEAACAKRKAPCRRAARSRAAVKK